ncbi:hybrid sensor histidine kinase/response regulator transcription factor [Terrimonas pollutisoli]|uniref:hybrid sensor histidine kinase/response regulator transcription factor n=1 Tax=Terrimonas pollutisoli TaxID=3034147 RepID=UPI0023EDE5A1|nr:substrate-binding domain-containing protein [Terrimonas sp. H1YJ31]
MKRYRLIIGGLLLLLTFFFIGCTSDKNKKAVVIGFSQNSGTAAWRKIMLDWMNRELTFYPEAELIYKDAKGNSELQVKQIRELLSQGIDILLVSPNEPYPLTPVIEECYKKGIPVIIIERKTASSFYSSYVGADNYEIGVLAGNYIRNILNGHGNIVEITGVPQTTPAIERHKGLLDGIKPASGIKIIAQVSGSWEKDSAAREISKITAKLQQADLVFAQNDLMALGAHEIYKKMKIARKIKFIGIDGLPGPNGGIQLVSDKILDATLLYPTGGTEAIQTAFKILHKEPYSKENKLQTLVIDSSNVRLMSLQLDKLNSQQSDIERRQRLIDKQIAITENQRIIIYITSITLALALILGSIAFYFLNENKKINKRLEKQNEEILAQRNQLIDQKNQLIEMTAKAKEATEAKFNFFTNISHEFRTPLTLLLGPLEHLLNSGKIHFSQKGYLEIAQKNTFRLLKLVNQLIDYRKLEQGKMKLMASENDLVSFIYELADSFQELARKQNITLQVRSKERKLNVWFDVNMLDKVIFNLLSNAFKFTPENGTIIISISKSESDQCAIVNVEDSGIGMTPETIEHAFDPFFQGNQSNYRGSGLGLSLSNELIKLHHGSIAVKSELNKGSNLEVHLPLGELHLTTEEKVNRQQKDMTPAYEDLKIYTTELSKIEMPNTELSPTDKENTLLIIEDNNDLRNLLKARLEQEYEILESARGDDGLKLAYESIPDLILCDIILPGKEGMQIINTLKNDVRTSHIPIILVTAKGSIEEQIKGMKQKADAFIVKPFNLQYLEETIKSLLKNREILKEHYTSELPIESKSETPKKIDRKFVNEFVSIIESNLSNENFGVDDISRKIGISRVQLYRKVKALLGYNVNDYIMTVRLQKAKYLLVNEDLSIAEIAYQVGFSSQAYFARLFKSKFGTTPTEHRAKKISDKRNE